MKAHDPRDTIRAVKEENIRDGDYVYSVGCQGIYYRGGIIWDVMESWNENEESKVYGEADWRDDTLAGSCVIKVRKVSGTTFFSKGVLNELGEFIKSKEDINVVYVNSALTSMQ